MRPFRREAPPQVEHRAPPEYPHRVRVLFAGHKPRGAQLAMRLTRPYFLFHYITAGAGRVVMGGREYRLSRGGGFFFFPGLFHEYEPAPSWGYAWVAFSGADGGALLADIGFSPENPVFQAPFDGGVKDRLDLLRLALKRRQRAATLEAQGHFFALCARLGRHAPSTPDASPRVGDDRMDRLRAHLESGLAQDLTVEKLSALVGLDPDYATRLFRRATGRTPAATLRELRMDSAWNQLRTTARPVSEVARTVGYGDPFTFSKAFRRCMGVSPTQCRRGDGRRVRVEKDGD